MDITIAREEPVTVTYHDIVYVIDGVEIVDKHGDFIDLLYALKRACMLEPLRIDGDEFKDKLVEAGLAERTGPNGVHCYGSDYLKKHIDEIVAAIRQAAAELQESQEPIDFSVAQGLGGW